MASSTVVCQNKWLMSTFGAYYLLAVHKEHTNERNFLLNMSSKQPICPKSDPGGEVEKEQLDLMYQYGSDKRFVGSGLLENDSPFQIIAMEKEAQTGFMHKD